MTTTTTVPTMLAFDVEVAAVQRLSPAMVRVTFAGECLREFGDGGPLGPRDLRVKVMLPAEGHPLPDLSDLSSGWYQRWLSLEESSRGWMRTYTVRRARPSGPSPEIDIDFVLHGHDDHDDGHSDSNGQGHGHGRPSFGPGAAWAARAAVGQRLTVLGPYAGTRAYGGIEWQPPAPVAGTDVRVLLAGDETAVPAVGSILERLPRGYVGHALLEVPTTEDVLRLSGGGVEVRWLPRNGRQRGAALRTALLDVMAAPGLTARPDGRPSADVVLEEVDVDNDILWETGPPPEHRPAEATATDCYAWVAGEAAVVRDLRRLLVRDLGLDRGRVAFMGYWREGRSEGI